MIWFVGAGSGAIDLLTVRGDKLLREADVVIYAGSLINPDLLTLLKPGAISHDSSAMTLEEVLEVMVATEMTGLTTVRLHTGDPSVYGAIREQMDELTKRDIAFAVVPGVSSFSAAAAAMQAEYTLPGVTQTLILTRMAGRTPVPDAEAIDRLATHGCSMAIFLSAAMLTELQEKLLAGAYEEDTPAAIVYKASWPDEKIYRCTIATLADTGKQYGIHKTALILVGKFLGDSYKRSRLYHPDFATGFRKARHED